jgi:hypothetical protein
MELGGDDAADAAVAAQDEVIGDLFEHTSGAPLLEALMQPALHDDRRQQRHGVERCSDAAEDQENREHLPPNDSGWTSRKPTVATVVTVM